MVSYMRTPRHKEPNKRQVLGNEEKERLQMGVVPKNRDKKVKEKGCKEL